MSEEVASGLTNPMVNQMPTPVTAPRTTVSKAKNLECSLTYPSNSESLCA